jgi:hypothetical protein
MSVFRAQIAGIKNPFLLKPAVVSALGYYDHSYLGAGKLSALLIQRQRSQLFATGGHEQHTQIQCITGQTHGLVVYLAHRV